MKKIKYILMLSAMVFLSFGCDEGGELTQDEQMQAEALESLQGTWIATEVRKDNTVISDFSNFSLTISEKNYSTQNGVPVWPVSGSFDFENAQTENRFLREDGRLFTAFVNNGTLLITIVYQEQTARGEYGTYEFVME